MTTYRFGEFELLPDHNIVRRNDKSRSLSPRVMDLLIYLVVNNERVIATEELLDRFWQGRVVEESTIHRHISQIRAVLGDSARDPQYIKTFSKRGYQAIAPVQTISIDNEISSNREVYLEEASRDEPSADLETTQRQSVTDDLWRGSILAVALLAIFGIVLDLGFSRSTENLTLEELKSIAVLPFVELSSRPENRDYGRALADIILDEMTEFDHIRVASRTATFELLEAGIGLDELAETLDVQYILEGSVQQYGGDLRLIAQLIRARDGFHVWSKTYDGKVDDRLALQQASGKNIAFFLESNIGFDAIRRHPEIFDEYRGIDPVAVEYFVQGQEQYSNYVAGEGGNATVALQLVEKAVASDPNFTFAQLDLAWNYTHRIDPTVNIQDSITGAHAAIAKALIEDPESHNALFYLAQIHIQLDLDYARAEQIIRRGMELYPGGDWWHGFLAGIAFREGRHAEALKLILEELKIVQGTDRPSLLTALAGIFLSSGNYERAIEITDEGLTLVGKSPARGIILLRRAEALYALGREAEAAKVLEEAWQLGGLEIPHEFAATFAALGEHERALRVLNTAVIAPGIRMPFISAYVYTGDLDKAFEILERAVEDHDSSVLESWHSAKALDLIRSDPRFVALEARKEAKVTHTEAFLGGRISDATASESI